jgi:hypothetical protein
VNDFLSLCEASETSGWSADRIMSFAIRAPANLGIWVLPDEGGWLAGLQVADRTEDDLDWQPGLQHRVRLTSPVRVPTDVLREQVRSDGVLRHLPGDGKPIEFPREEVGYAGWSLDLSTGTVEVEADTEVVEVRVEAYWLKPPRRVDKASLFVRRGEWAAVVATEGHPDLREGRIARLQAAVNAGVCSLSVPGAAKALGMNAKTLGRRVQKAEGLRDIPRVWSMFEGKKGNRRYQLLEDIAALRLWLELVEATSRGKQGQVVAAAPTPPRPPARPGMASSREGIRDRARRTRKKG